MVPPTVKHYKYSMDNFWHLKLKAFMFLDILGGMSRLDFTKLWHVVTGSKNLLGLLIYTQERLRDSKTFPRIKL